MTEGVLLAGVVGSTAYGLAGPGSDVDRLGVFAAPTEALLGLRAPRETYVSHEPDVTFHEAGKYVRLALGVNPTVTELLWLPGHEVRTGLGDELVGIRGAFLSAERVRDAYLGYAVQQFRRLAGREPGARAAKHARHLARLAHQGLDLYRTGVLTVRLDDPGWYHAFGAQVAAGDLTAARRVIADAEAAFAEVRSPLPDQPDEAAAERWLLAVRHACYAPPA